MLRVDLDDIAVAGSIDRHAIVEKQKQSKVAAFWMNQQGLLKPE